MLEMGTLFVWKGSGRAQTQWLYLRIPVCDHVTSSIDKTGGGIRTFLLGIVYIELDKKSNAVGITWYERVRFFPYLGFREGVSKTLMTS